MASKEEALARAFEALLEKYDPLRQAERAALRLKKRLERKPTSIAPDGDQESVCGGKVTESNWLGDEVQVHGKA